MASYIVLANFTDQGVRHVKDTVQRAEAFKVLANTAGAAVKDVYWTLGQYDIVALCEAPDDETITALSLSVAGFGNVKTQTLRAFPAAEMAKILGKMA
jgi:uncharacterized protein with GYD domain